MRDMEKKRARKRAWDAAHRDQKKAYYTRNRDAILAKERAFRLANAEKLRERRRALMVSNPERHKAIKERRKAWRILNRARLREYDRAYSAANRARKREVARLSKTKRREIINAQKRAWYKLNRDKVRERARRAFKAHVEGLSPRYLTHLLLRKPADTLVSPELLEVKRKLVELKRELRKAKQNEDHEPNPGTVVRGDRRAAGEEDHGGQCERRGECDGQNPHHHQDGDGVCQVRGQVGEHEVHRAGGREGGGRAQAQASGKAMSNVEHTNTEEDRCYQ